MIKHYKIGIAMLLPMMVIFIIIMISGGGRDTNMNLKEANISQKKLYKNPIAVKGDFADPYIFKFNGVYYLYCTNPGVKCWSSKNLIDWKLEGTVIEDDTFSGLVPFAPEVVYWNGYFYMYTSPSGLGHYILRSDSPTGPFKVMTENLGYSIDGSVFIDDDGRWYFYTADNSGIIAYTMRDPLTIWDANYTNINMQGWTEGPGVIKRNGKYYMTYTGNHYLSTGYRVDYAVSSEGPISGYIPYSKNPFLINTEGNGVGLGHSTSFIGPDLDTRYITYHNLNPDATRDLNIDELAWNGDKMMVLGPTQSNQIVPDMPDFYEYFDGNKLDNNWELHKGTWKCDNNYLLMDMKNKEEVNMITSRYKSGKDYTAEFNMKLSKGLNSRASRFGAIVSYKDEKNYGTILLNPVENTVETKFIIEGRYSEEEVSKLPHGYDYTRLHNIRIEKCSDTIKVFVDGMLKQTRRADGLEGGSIGFYSEAAEAVFGYTALTNSVNGESIYKAYKPVPGTIEAVYYNPGSGYCLKEKDDGNSDFRRDGFHLSTCSEGGYNTAFKEEGEWLAYNISVDETCKYNLDLRVSEVKRGTVIKLIVDGKAISKNLDLNIDETDEWRTISIKKLELKEGLHTLRLELIKGGFKFYSMSFYKASKEVIDFKENFDNGLGKWSYVTGLGEDSKIYGAALRLGPYGKLAAGDSGWDDYTVESYIKGDSGLNSGIIFRVTNPAEGGEGKDCFLGTNFYQGYFAGLTEEGVVLGKQNYSWKELVRCGGKLDCSKEYHLKVTVKGDNIKVFVDDMKTAKIDYTDKDPFTHGKAGIRTEGEIAFFRGFKVTGE